MKPFKQLFFLLSFMFAGISPILAQGTAEQDSTGLPGDNFSLQGALKLFEQSNSIEEFEKLLNTKDNNVNNLDLNGDGETDYIRVVDKQEKDAHAFVLQVPVSETENQDIAVIELEKTGKENALVQIIGDEDMFGDETIVEPGDGADDAGDVTMQNGNGPNAGNYHADNTGIVVNVWFWPCVRFVYGPVYRPWISPWRWRYYPTWWHPWRPLAWHAYRPLPWRYHTGFAIVHTHRVVHAHAIYRPVRVTSVTVRTRNEPALNRYHVTHTRTTVTGPRGNKVTRTQTTVRGPHGKVKAQKTKVRRKRG